jgi:hypothetical protein
MATISFTKTSNGYIAKIEGHSTKWSIKLLQRYAELNKLDVQNIIISGNSAFPTSWEQHLLTIGGQ